MRITLLTPGTAHFYCGSCLRDSALARALRAIGHEALMVPMYLPFVLEQAEPQDLAPRVRMGAINMYLQHKLPLLRHTPRFLADALDSPALLRWASRRGHMTDAHDLGAMTLSMLRGEDGRMAGEIEKLVAWLAREPAPDVFLLSNVMLAGVARPLKERIDRPIVCTLQGEAPFLDALPPAFRGRAWEELAARAADLDLLVPVSAHYGDLMRARLGVAAERLQVVHNGIDVADFVGLERDPRAPPAIGYLARMCADKGLHTLVDAFLLLRQRALVPGLKLRVAGAMLEHDRAFVEEQRAKLRAAGLEGESAFLPDVSRAQKLDFLASLSLLSVPATYGESFGLYLLEAMAAGVPVVQPRSGAFPEVLAATGGGLLCEPDDPESLADGLARLLMDPTAAAALAARGRAAVVESFDLEHMARGMERACRQVTC